MIPIKISLQNFLSYRNDVPPLDLAGIHLACLGRLFANYPRVGPRQEGDRLRGQ